MRLLVTIPEYVMRAFAVLLACVVIIGQSPPLRAQTPKLDDANAKDLKDLQGKWKVVKFALGAEETAPAELAKNNVQIIVKDAALHFVEKGKVGKRGLLTLNSKASPKQIDLQETDEKGNVKKMKLGTKKEAPKEVEVSAEKGLYELKGDKLKLILADRGKERPKAFDSKGDFMLIVLERLKE